MNTLRIAGLVFYLLTSPAWAVVDAPAGKAPDFSEMSLEQLMSEPVTAVSRKEQRVRDVAAAITVLTNDDLRRSGVTTIPDALRMVPGMDIGSVNAREPAVSARGFNGIYANKLLVLVDGRTAYSPLASGVFWDMQETMLEDVDRIEVIRGPGATVWGANAVDGVINVVSRGAKYTQGALLYAGGGGVLEAISGARYGGRIGEDTYYRVFGSYQAHGDYPLANGLSAKDGWTGSHGGFRIDRYPDQDTHLTWQSDVTGMNYDEGTSDGYNVNTLGRWTRQLSGHASIEAQAYYDRTYDSESSRTRNIADTADLSFQHIFTLSKSHEIIWGLGYRYIEGHVRQLNSFAAVRNGSFNMKVFSTFAQDEFKLVPDKLTLTTGIKIEHNDSTGVELQPSIRAVFKPAQRQTVWGAVSRAVRTPEALETKDILAIAAGPPLVGPGGGLYVPRIVGNANPASEVLWAYEIGYRAQPTSRVNVDFAGFFNKYSRLISSGNVARFLPGVPVGTAEIPLLNLRSAKIYGGEAAVTVSMTDQWRLIAAYSLSAQINGPASPSQPGVLEAPPKNQFNLRSSYDFTARMSLDAQLRKIGPIQSVPGYLTADLRFAYELTGGLVLSLVGQNLLDNRHPERGPTLISVTAEVPRSGFAKLNWKF